MAVPVLTWSTHTAAHALPDTPEMTVKPVSNIELMYAFHCINVNYTLLSKSLMNLNCVHSRMHANVHAYGNTHTLHTILLADGFV